MVEVLILSVIISLLMLAIIGCAIDIYTYMGLKKRVKHLENTYVDIFMLDKCFEEAFYEIDCDEHLKYYIKGVIKNEKV